MTEDNDSTKYILGPDGRQPEGAISSDEVDTPAGSQQEMELGRQLQGVLWNRLKNGRFEPRTVLGRGGFGAVYRAYDRKLHREVALKIPHHDSVGDSASQQRLQREGLASAALQHPHIVRLYDFEVSDQTSFLVQELIEGHSLSHFIQQHPNGCDPRVAAQIVLLLAEGLQHAHSKGILHRDIKPANILLDVDGKAAELPFSPRLADFGLATAPTLETLSKTADGLVGSLHYVPPEMLKGRQENFTAQGDIYALTLVLRELLTGTRAASGSNVSQILNQIAEGQFVDLGLIRGKVSRDLLAICVQGTDINPHRRYLSAGQLAEDLQRYLDGRPVVARPPGSLERSWRWVRRNPTLTVSTVILGFALTSITALVLLNNHRLSANLQELRNAQFHNEQIIYAQDMAQASADLQSRDLRSVRATLDRYAEGQPLHKHCDADWHWMQRRTKEIYQSSTLRKPSYALYSACFRDDGRSLFVSGASSKISILAMPDASLQHQLDGGQVEVNCLQLKSGSSVLWSSGDDGTVCAWDLQTDQLKWRTQAFQPPTKAYDFVYLEQLDQLVVRGSDDSLSCLSAQDGMLQPELRLQDVLCTSITNLNDGRHFLVADNRRRLFRVDGTDMQTVQELPLETAEHPRNPTIPARAAEVSTDGNWAIAFTKDNVVYLIDLNQWSITDSIQVSELPRKICFFGFSGLADSGDRQRFWLITQPGIYYEFEIGSDGKLLETAKWTSDGERVFHALQRPGTQELFTLDGQGQLKRWVEGGAEWLLNHRNISGEHRGHLMLDASRGLESSVCQLTEHLFVYTCHASIDVFSSRGQWQRFFVKAKKACVCDVGPAGLWVIEQPTVAKSVSWNTVIEQFQVGTPEKWTEVELPWQERTLPFRADELNLPSQFYRLVATDDGQWIAGCDQQAGSVWCMPPDKPQSVRTVAAPEVTLVWFEPASQCCWWVSQHRQIYRWNLADGSSPQMVTELPNLSARALAMSPDKSLLAIQCEHKTCYLLDLNQNKIVSEITFEDELLDVAFSDSGKTLMMLGGTGRVACWNLASGRKTFQQAYTTSDIRGGFSKDGRYLIRSSQDDMRWQIEPLGDWSIR